MRALATVTNCVLTVTQPSRPSGRGHRVQATPVSVAASAAGIAVLEPEGLRDVRDALAQAQADLFVVASYGKIVPQWVLELPRIGALNVHPSVLPLYRGATPLQSQIRDGVRDSGVTVIWMDAGMDTGDIALVELSPIGESETYGELHDRFAKLGAAALERALVLAARGALSRVPQADSAIAPERIAATKTRPLGANDLVLDWQAPAQTVAGKVRSLAPAPAARATLDGFVDPFKIVAARVAQSDEFEATAAVAATLPGTLAESARREPVVACGEGAVVLERLIPPNRKPMSGREFMDWQRRSPARSLQ